MAITINDERALVVGGSSEYKISKCDNEYPFGWPNGLKQRGSFVCGGAFN